MQIKTTERGLLSLFRMVIAKINETTKDSGEDVWWGGGGVYTLWVGM